MASGPALNRNNVLHENIIMPNADLPVFFVEHAYNNTGPYCVMHWHDEIELVYVVRGRIASHCNSDTIYAEAGDFIFVNSNEFHDYSVLEAPISLYCAVMDLSLLQGRYLSSYDSEYITASQKIAIFQNHIVDSKPMKDFFMSMWAENKEKKIGYEYAIKSDIYGIFSLLLRSHMKYTISGKQNRHRTQNVHKINEVIKYIEEHYRDEISLDDMAGVLNFNRFYFCRFFREITGVTPGEFVNNYRIHQAISLMSGCPEMTITSIALKCRFNDPNYFSRTFRSITGYTPRSYRAKLAEQQDRDQPVDHKFGWFLT